MDGLSRMLSAPSDTGAIRCRDFAHEDLDPESGRMVTESDRRSSFSNLATLPASAAKDFERAAAFQWAVLAEDAMSEGHSERAKELIELAYSANDPDSPRL